MLGKRKLTALSGFLISILLLSIGYITGFHSSNTQKKSSQNQSNENTNKNLIKVTRVIDGDTIEIEGNIKVRYIGINTPETVDPRKPVECFGTEASNKNKTLVEGKLVKLEKDVSETDKYGRLLRYVYVGDIFVNDYLVKNGFAFASSFPPDIKHQDQFSNSQKEAQSSKLGLWAPNACETANPDQTTKTDSSNPQNPNSACLIKGNISSTKEKIYHMPGQRYYDKTVVEESKGEKWFCTEEEATSAGFRKSKV